MILCAYVGWNLLIGCRAAYPMSQWREKRATAMRLGDCSNGIERYRSGINLSVIIYSSSSLPRSPSLCRLDCVWVIVGACLFACVRVCVCVCVFVCLFVCPSCLFVCLSVCLFVSVSLSVSVCLCLSLYLSLFVCFCACGWVFPMRDGCSDLHRSSCSE